MKFLSALLITTSLCALSLEEKVGQLLMVYFDGETYNEEARRFTDELHVGGFIYYTWANGLTSHDDIRHLSRELQAHSRIPLFIATDQEGGLVTRLQTGTALPGNGALGFIDDTALTYKATRLLANELSSVGINMNFAPVVDVNTNPENPVIGIRSFGADQALVKRHGAAAVQAHLDAGIIPTLKHFPGHGDTALDSHKALPTASSICLNPFTIDTPAIMTAHILTELDPNRCATISPIVLQEVLRKKLGFKGLIVSDSITMAGLLDQCGTLPEAAVAAIGAGCDMIVIGGRSLTSKEQYETSYEAVSDVYHALLEAARSGEIDIDRSVERILRLKQQLPSNLPFEIARRSVFLAQGSLPKLSGKSLLIAPQSLRSIVEESGLPSLVTAVHFSSDRIPQGYDTYIAIVYKKPEQALPKDAFIIDVGYASTRHANVLKTHSPTLASLTVAKEWLERAVPFVTPIDPEAIGKFIWENECHGRTDQLTFWNEREPFPSLGIGHFIWPPKTYEGPFQSGRFHDFLAFLTKKGVHHSFSRYSPWETRDAFYKAFHSQEMEALRTLLQNTISLQAEYMVHRLNRALIDIIEAAPVEKRAHIMRQFYRLADSPHVLIDYLNFKHEGTDPKERFHGEGWGLLQVLSTMGETDDPIADFITAARKCLDKRIENNPLDRRWQKGWHARLMSYTKLFYYLSN